MCVIFIKIFIANSVRCAFPVLRSHVMEMPQPSTDATSVALRAASYDHAHFAAERNTVHCVFFSTSCLQKECCTLGLGRNCALSSADTTNVRLRPAARRSGRGGRGGRGVRVR